MHTMAMRRRLLGIVGPHIRKLELTEQQWGRTSNILSTAATSSLNNHVTLSTSARMSTSTDAHRATTTLLHNHVPLTNMETAPTLSPRSDDVGNLSRPISPLRRDTLKSHIADKGSPEYVMPFSGMPEAKGVPILGTLPERLWAGGPSYLYRYIDARHRDLGDVFKLRLDGIDIVFINDPEAARQVFANEGSTPWHYVPSSWELYNQTYGVSRGLFFMYGDEWLANRRPLNPHLLRPAAMAHHVPTLAGVTRDALSEWLSHEKCSSGDNIGENELTPVSNLEKRLYRWTLDSFCVQMFGHPCGFISGLHDDFLDALKVMAVEAGKMQHLVPPDLAKRYNLPIWTRFVHASTTAIEKARALVEKEVSIAHDRVLAGLEEPVAIVDHLITSNDLDHQIIVRHVMDFLMAAADTTAHTLSWCLYLVGQHPEAQQKAQLEVLAATGGDMTRLSGGSLAALPYIKGVVKEGLRMYPVAPFILRALSQDAVLGGYNAPAGTISALSVYSTGRDSRFFHDADDFIPERWLRHQSSAAITCPRKSTGRHHGHAFLPFGIGSRSCIGRRLAEAQLQVFLAQLLATCRVTTLQDNHMVMRMFSVPSKPLQIAIQPYNN